MSKPFSQACENNKDPILEVIKEVFTSPQTVLEIGSGTGQHAIYFAEQLPHLQWQTSDRLENHQGIQSWLEEASLPNVHPPLPLDVTQQPWPVEQIDALFTANTLHIMGWEEVMIFFERLGEYLSQDAFACIYGPFNYNGEYTSESNARFDQWLKQQNPKSAIRHKEDVEKLAIKNGINLVKDIAMPANNRLLVWQKTGP